MEEGISQLIDMVANLKITINEKFEQVDRRFEEIDKRLDDMDKRFEAIDRRFEAIDDRFDQVDKRFEEIDKRFDTLNIKFDKQNDNFQKIINSLKVMKGDIYNNREHIDKLENKDKYFQVGEKGRDLNK
jgi:chromosome segregation ATPase